jgi:hypothetical protein
MLELDGESRFAGRAFDLVSIYAHEFGHALDGAAHAFSSHPDWHQAWAAEIVPRFQGQNPATTPQEGFSKFAQVVYCGQVSRDDVERDYPLCVDYWRRQDLW